MTQDPWYPILKLAAEEYLEWHDHSTRGSFRPTAWKVRGILRERAISAYRFDDVEKIIRDELERRFAAYKVSQRLLK